MKVIPKMMIVGLSMCTAMVAADVVSSPSKDAHLSGNLDYANAKPMPLPRVDRSMAEAGLLEKPVLNDNDGVAGYRPGSEGNGEILKKAVKLPVSSQVTESSLSKESIAPMEYGLDNHPYTTSRVDGAGSYGNSKKYPYSATGKLYFDIDGSTYVCSASLIQPGILVTAAHCVAEWGQQKFYSGWEYYPALKKRTAPFGGWAAGSATIMTSYYDGTDNCAVDGVVCDDDVAVIVLEQKDSKNLGESTGWLGYAWNGWGFSSFKDMDAIEVSQLGYPQSHDSGLRMQRTDSLGYKDIDLVDNTVIGSRMTGGSSGGPWIANLGSKAQLSGGATFGNKKGMNIVIGVTSWGYINDDYKEQGATRFTDGNIKPLVDAVCTGYPERCKK